ncbi:hypothetical protein GDO86_000412 [Hymenochirus boettgeri]|uniref:Carrier domain-containing protein n=1 Tax=Hymenochirus boettgeri TaxID=247094 RepID=A0A8T2KD47_9PIPI|nr:hypothetical protein GDO86_000412 [Hymenochirus boettgeri]
MACQAAFIRLQGIFLLPYLDVLLIKASSLALTSTHVKTCTQTLLRLDYQPLQATIHSQPPHDIFVHAVRHFPTTNFPSFGEDPSAQATSPPDTIRISIHQAMRLVGKMNFKLIFTDWTEHNSSRIQHLDVILFTVRGNGIPIVLSLRQKLHEQGNETDEHGPQEHGNTAEKFDQNGKVKENLNCQEKHCLAYILHTSGTTGAPKIVSVPHQCIVPNIVHLRRIFDITPSDLLFLASPLTFDPSVIELFLALSSGACLLIVPNPIKMMPDMLCNLLFHQHRVTVLQVTPTFLRRFGSHSIRSSLLCEGSCLRVLALGGEPFPAIRVIRGWKEPGNRTRLFNLYGITEVSSWATYYEIPEQMIYVQKGEEPSVPLGIPLYGTIVEIQNEDGSKTTKGEGQVLLGGRERMCFIDKELILPYGTLRKTGDWVTLRNGEMFFLGRKDNQIKRHGKRINLEYVQHVAESIGLVDTCTTLWFQDSKLIIFAVPKDSVEKKILWKELQSHLLSYAVPDDMILVDSLPLTKHGKVDTSSLNHMYCEYLQNKKSPYLLQGPDDLWKSLQIIWKSVLGLPEETPAVPEDSLFLLSGGDSLTVMRLQQEIETLVGRPVTGLVEAILNNSFLSIYKHISKSMQVNEQKSNKNQHSVSEDIRHSPINESRKNVGKRKDHPDKLKGNVNWFVSLSRGSCLYGNLPAEIAAQQYLLYNGLNSDSKRLKQNQDKLFTEFSHDRTSNHAYKSSMGGSLNRATLYLQQKWMSDTGKCVDASPLLVKPVNDSPVTIYIGSHSHRMQALDLQTGKVIWERVLGDRIESSAGVSKCGTFILVGCYDGSLYVLCKWDGRTHWIFRTGNTVKSSPAVDSLGGLVFVGSHDEHLYALDIEEKKCVWKSYCGGGALFSSPFLCFKPYHLYVATLRGLIMAVHPGTGRIIWKYDCGKPIFASPLCSSDHVFIGCVDENFYCFSHEGEKIWNFTTNGPIFSSPCLSQLSNFIIFGSHDGFIYCCNIVGGLVWKYKTSSRVYATPFVFPHPSTFDCELLAAASTDGNLYILDLQTGLLQIEYRLEGEIFSSPVVWRSNLVIGCRNDYVYCLDLLYKNAGE